VRLLNQGVSVKVHEAALLQTLPLIQKPDAPAIRAAGDELTGLAANQQQ
jgi:hypothetical protein